MDTKHTDTDMENKYPETNIFSGKLSLPVVPASRAWSHWFDQCAKMEVERDEAMKRVAELESEIENAKQALWSLGLHPRYHTTLPESVSAVGRIVAVLRRDLADPPAHIQECVLEKLGVHERLCTLTQERDEARNRVAELEQDSARLDALELVHVVSNGHGKAKASVGMDGPIVHGSNLREVADKILEAKRTRRTSR